MILQLILKFFIYTGLLIINFLSLNTFCDCPEVNQMFVQDPATPTMEGMIGFHNILMFAMVGVGVFVFYMLFYAMYTFTANKVENSAQFSHNSPLEIIWTILPAVILLFIAVPSFSLLYSLDELIDPQLTIKIIGHQWYWSYEYSDFTLRSEIKQIAFDSYMVPVEDLEDKYTFGCRLLVSRPELVLPTNTHIRLLVSSADVLHSWAVPSFGIKIDACPGRLSQGSLLINRAVTHDSGAVFFGQCSEICGVNHGFMPITVIALTPEKFQLILQK